MKRIFRPIFILAIFATLCAVDAAAGDTQPRVFLNPGHGGHDSDDRYMPFYNWAAGDTVDYYESDSNLGIGTALMAILREKGYDIVTSRVQNTTDDDLDLFEICQLAENSGADLFFSIHSNATGTSLRANFPLALYRGVTGEPVVEGSDSIASCVMRHFQANKATSHSRRPMISGDWTFYDWGYGVGLGVLRYNKLPGMLNEGSFHDYVPERERFLNSDYHWLEAWNESLAIDDYFNKARKFKSGMIAGLVRYSEPRVDVDSIKTFGDDFNQPVSGASVSLYDRDGKLQAHYTTDNLNNGFYAFKNLKPGQYRLEAVFSENQRSNPVVKWVEVKPNASTYCNFTAPREHLMTP